MKNSKEALEVVYNNALDLILNKKLKEGEKLLEKIYGSGNINIDILNLLGIIKYMYCDFYGAKKYWNESLKISYEDNKASEFIEDIESDDFKLISEKYKDSISLIEDKDYLQAIENLEEINKRRSELIEVKILLALLYMTIDEKKKAFKNIESALSYDTSNYKIKERYDEIKCDLVKGQDEEKEESEELTFSQSILSLIMILNYRINSFYEEELKYRNEEIKSLYEEIKTMNLEIESLNTEKEKLSL
ncbi:tetratricopeptide repeat protein [Clostridium perfringens]|uniref:tetratricopeptide repeat protein n=1 Tax=Clostridium perfringens TaxID=1502 RepID=UPI0034A4BAAE